MKDIEKLKNSSLSSNYTVLKSKNKVMILPPLDKIGIELVGMNVYETEVTKINFRLIESNEKIVFNDLNSGLFIGFDIDDIIENKIHFCNENGLCETWTAKEIKSSGDLQLYLQ